MIEAQELTRRFGATTVVDRLTFTVQPGAVTGFLGPNGAGKSTTMRMILGLIRPTSGQVTIGGRCYRNLPAPLHEAGALLDASAIQGNRTARRHLAWFAEAGGIPLRRVDQMLKMVGLIEVADRKTGDFSLGMSQRLGIATALIGDPRVLLLDEPVNGLDPEGICWLRSLLRGLADEGRSILISSHLMSEMETMVDRVLVIAGGRLLADASVADFTGRSATGRVLVRTPRRAEFARLLERAGAAVRTEHGALLVSGLGAEGMGELAAKHQIVLHELTRQRRSLEAAFMELTHDRVQYRAGGLISQEDGAVALVAAEEFSG